MARGRRDHRLRRTAFGKAKTFAQEVALVAVDQLQAKQLVDEIGVAAAIGARGPAVVWRPAVARPAASQLRFLLRYWLDLAATPPMPPASAIDAVEMRAALGYIMLVDVVDGGRDFRYRLFGSTIAAVSGFDMTGKLVTSHPASPYVVEFALAVYRAVLARGEPLLTEHGPPNSVNTHAWHRLVLPLAGPDGALSRFIVGNLPIARNGQAITQRL